MLLCENTENLLLYIKQSKIMENSIDCNYNDEFITSFKKEIDSLMKF